MEQTINLNDYKDAIIMQNCEGIWCAYGLDGKKTEIQAKKEDEDAKEGTSE